MLVKSTTGVNCINVLCTAFTHTDPESVKFQLSHQYLFTLLGSTHVKSACITLMKLTPGLNFNNVLHTAFALADPKSVKRCGVT